MRFLWIVAGLTVLVVIGASLYRYFEKESDALGAGAERRVPRGADAGGADYGKAGMWIARPDIAGNPSLWAPQGFAATRAPRASVFFVHPTSFLESSAWNAPVDDEESQDRAAAVRAQPGERVQFGRARSGRPNTGRRRSAPS